MFPWNFFPFSKDMQAKLQQMKPEEINQICTKHNEQNVSIYFPTFYEHESK